MNWKSHKLLTVLLVLGLVLGAAACGGPTPTPEPTEPPAETEGRTRRARANRCSGDRRGSGAQGRAAFALQRAHRSVW